MDVRWATFDARRSTPRAAEGCYPAPLWRHPKGTMGALRGSDLKPLRLKELWCKCQPQSLIMGFLQRVLLANRVLLARQWARLEEPWAALPPGPGRDTGISLLFGQGIAVSPGGGAEPGAGAQLRGCARIVGNDVGPAYLFAVADEPDPIAAVTALEGGIKTFPTGTAQGAAGAYAFRSDRASHTNDSGYTPVHFFRAGAPCCQ